jgi:hypothetical protein
MNAADTSEWYRAIYRSMQDTRGAIRFLINDANLKIDPNNVFIAGESAGGFIALQTAFMDDPSEKPLDCGLLAAVPAPNDIYQNNCITKFGLDTSIAQMQLARPDLGDIQGTFWTNAPPFRIRGVGALYAAMNTDLFLQNTYDVPPAIFMFHQPNDLIVPFNCEKMLAGYTYCLSGGLTNCGNIINRPYLCGSNGIKNAIDALGAQGYNVPEYVVDFTNNNADCFTQVVLNQSLSGHTLPNYWGTTLKMAHLFASKVADCTVSTTMAADQSANIYISPNPAKSTLQVVNKGDFTISSAHIYTLQGKSIFEMSVPKATNFDISLPPVAAGIYLLALQTDRGWITKKVVLE